MDDDILVFAFSRTWTPRSMHSREITWLRLKKMLEKGKIDISFHPRSFDRSLTLELPKLISKRDDILVICWCSIDASSRDYVASLGKMLQQENDLVRNQRTLVENANFNNSITIIWIISIISIAQYEMFPISNETPILKWHESHCRLISKDSLNYKFERIATELLSFSIFSGGGRGDEWFDYARRRPSKHDCVPATLGFLSRNRPIIAAQRNAQIVCVKVHRGVQTRVQTEQRERERERERENEEDRKGRTSDRERKRRRRQAQEREEATVSGLPERKRSL